MKKLKKGFYILEREEREPKIVWVVGMSAISNSWPDQEPIYICEELNTGITSFAAPRSLTKIEESDFNYDDFKKLYYKKMREIYKKSVIRFSSLIAELEQ